eukprot:gene6875-biopygen13892
MTPCVSWFVELGLQKKSVPDTSILVLRGGGGGGGDGGG